MSVEREIEKLREEIRQRGFRDRIFVARLIVR